MVPSPGPRRHHGEPTQGGGERAERTLGTRFAVRPRANLANRGKRWRCRARAGQGNFDTYPVVRLQDAPKTEVYLSPTPGKRWGGVGEPGATMIQPAVTNAIFAATGKRLPSLPIRGQDLIGGA